MKFWGILAAICLTAFVVIVAQTTPIPNTSPMKKGQKTMDKETLAKKVETIHPEVTDKIRSADSTIEEINTPFFKNGGVHRVVYPMLSRPITFIFGTAGDDFVVSLPKNQENFMELAQRAGLQIDSDELRVKYVEVFLETTRDFQMRFQILRRFSDIEPLNQPSKDEKARYESVEATYKSKIEPPQISGESPWLVKLFVLKRQDLLRLTVKLASDGRMEIGEEILEKELPIPFVK